MISVEFLASPFAISESIAGTTCKIPSKKKWLFWGSRLSPFATHTHWLQNNGIWVEADPEQQVITKIQVDQGDQPRLPTIMHSFAGMRLHDGRKPPAEGEKKKKEKFYIYPDVTHTHTNDFYWLSCLTLFDQIWLKHVEGKKSAILQHDHTSYLGIFGNEYVNEWFYHLLSVGP